MIPPIIVLSAAFAFDEKLALYGEPLRGTILPLSSSNSILISTSHSSLQVYEQ
jgi:hypothetical protein